MTTPDGKILIRAKLVRQTPNTLRFQEINDRGELLDMADSLVGTVYVKKSNFDPKVGWPDMIQISIEPVS